MSFPSCKHAKARRAPLSGLLWLASEPFRLFFITGMIWSIAGVALWPLFYAGKLPVYPGQIHARLMIQCFGGAFVIGFLGTAGPRIASAPRLTPLELIAMVLLHLSVGVAHLSQKIILGDIAFIILISCLITSLLVRMLRFRREPIPPQLILALGGLVLAVCGTALSVMISKGIALGWPGSLRFAQLSLFQGFLLLPVLGIGSFLFPRILGGDFGEPANTQEAKSKRWRAMATAFLLILSFVMEAIGLLWLGVILRVGVSLFYLVTEIRWNKIAPSRTLSRGIYWALGSLLLGLVWTAVSPQRLIAVEHLAFISGFGLLMLIVASRVLFGHSGNLEGFSKRHWWPPTLIILSILAALTRTSADFLPNIMISHYKYAAWLWMLISVIWLVWHRKRFFMRDTEE